MEMPDTRSPHLLPLPALLQQLAHELGALQLMAADMEASVDDMIERHAGVLDARSIQNLQLLDILNQTLLALAMFAGNAAALSSSEWTVDSRAATAQIKLASLAHHGLSRAIDPVTAHDGDTLFALATGACGRRGDLTLLGHPVPSNVSVASRYCTNAMTSSSSSVSTPSSHSALGSPPTRSAKGLSICTRHGDRIAIESTSGINRWRPRKVCMAARAQSAL
jgi:hypothetical protein